jgi:PAS domain S-box-containing protein
MPATRQIRSNPQNRDAEEAASLVRSARVGQLYSQSASGLLGATFSAVILVCALREVIPLSLLLTWLGLYLAVQAARFGLIVAFRRTSPGSRSVTFWERYFSIGIAIAAFMWGVAGVVFYAEDSVHHEFLLALFLAGLSAAATVVYGRSTTTSVPAILLMLLPMSCRFMYHGDEVHVTMGVVIALYAGVLTLTARSVHEVSRDSLSLRFENQGLIESMMEENRRADELNRQFRDEIADRYRAQEALRESEERYRQLIDLSPDGIYVNIGGHFAFANRSAARIFGFQSPEELQGRRVIDLEHPDTRDEVMERIRVLLEERRPVPLMEKTLVRPNGTTVDVEVSAAPINYGGLPAAQVTVRDITERKIAEESIQRSLNEKEILLREIHHRVKNNLQVVSSLLSLQARHVSDRSVRVMFVESRNRLDAMALIHELLYRSSDLADIDLNKYINSLASLLLASYEVPGNRVSFITHVAPVSMSVDTAIPCGLIANELVSNCLKHAFPDGREGLITISLAAENGRFQLAISDNGVGMPDGMDLENPETLGIRIVRTLVRQLQGDIELDRSCGTEFRIRFSEAPQTTS